MTILHSQTEKAGGPKWLPVLLYPARNPILVICFAVAILQIYLITWPDPKLIIYPDSIGYMGSVVDAFENGTLTHSKARSFVYPLFLLSVLQISPEPTSIVYAQRILVLITYTSVATGAWLLADFVRRIQMRQQVVNSIIIFFWLVVLAAHSTSTLLAHSVLAETLFSCLSSLIILSILLVAIPSGLRESWLLVVPVAVAIVCAIALIFVKPHWIVVPFVLPPILIWLMPKGRRGHGAVALAAGIFIGIAGFVLPERALQQRYDAYKSKVFGPRTLFCNSADLIYTYLQTKQLDPTEVQLSRLLGEVVSKEAREIAADAGWRWLGFNGDKCSYGPAAKLLEARFGGGASKEADYYFGTYVSAVVRHPDYLLRRLGTQLGWLMLRPFSSPHDGEVADLRFVREEAESHGFYKYWLEERADDLVGTVSSRFVSIQVLQKLLYIILAPAILLGGLIIVVKNSAFGVASGDRAASLSPLYRALLALCAMCVGANAAIAIVHTFDVERYVVMQAPLFVTIGMISSLLAFGSGPDLACSRSKRYSITGT